MMSKCKTCNLSPIAMNDVVHWSGVVGKPSLFKLHRVMVTGFFKHAQKNFFWFVMVSIQVSAENSIQLPFKELQCPYQGADHVQGQNHVSIGSHHMKK